MDVHRRLIHGRTFSRILVDSRIIIARLFDIRRSPEPAGPTSSLVAFGSRVDMVIGTLAVAQFGLQFPGLAFCHPVRLSAPGHGIGFTVATTVDEPKRRVGRFGARHSTIDTVCPTTSVMGSTPTGFRCSELRSGSPLSWCLR